MTEDVSLENELDEVLGLINKELQITEEKDLVKKTSTLSVRSTSYAFWS